MTDTETLSAQCASEHVISAAYLHQLKHTRHIDLEYQTETILSNDISESTLHQNCLFYCHHQ